MDLQTKKSVRKLLLEKRESFDTILRKEWDISIFNNLIKSQFYKNAKFIFAYVSFKSEVDTLGFIEYALGDNKIVCVPKIESKEKGIEFFEINSLAHLKAGYYGILEPTANCPSANLKEIDLMLIPGLAFDILGGRLGYGAGYYDRFLYQTKLNFNKVGIAYDFQVIDKVPMDEHDVRIDGIITTKDIIYATKAT